MSTLLPQTFNCYFEHDHDDCLIRAQGLLENYELMNVGDPCGHVRQRGLQMSGDYLNHCRPIFGKEIFTCLGVMLCLVAASDRGVGGERFSTDSMVSITHK